MAVALQDGGVTPVAFTQERIHDPALRKLVGKMSIRENEAFTQKYPGEYNCRMEITEQSGKVFTAETAYPKGHRANPLSDLEIETKFQESNRGRVESAPMPPGSGFGLVPRQPIKPARFVRQFGNIRPRHQSGGSKSTYEYVDVAAAATMRRPDPVDYQDLGESPTHQQDRVFGKRRARGLV